MHDNKHSSDSYISKLESENRSLKANIAELKLKADRFDEMVEKRLLKSIDATAAELGLDKDTLVSFLISRKYLSCDETGKTVPHKCFVTDGLFVVDEDKASENFDAEFDDNEDFNEDRNLPSETHIFITPKGIETLKLMTKLFIG